MAICPSCNAQNDPSALFCTNCGRSLPVLPVEPVQAVAAVELESAAPAPAPSAPAPEPPAPAPSEAAAPEASAPQPAAPEAPAAAPVEPVQAAPAATELPPFPAFDGPPALSRYVPPESSEVTPPPFPAMVPPAAPAAPVPPAFAPPPAMYAPPSPVQPAAYAGAYASSYAARAPKDRSLALVLEILPGFFGILGIGWLYGGNTNVGIAVLLGMLAWDALEVVTSVILGALTAGIGCLCFLPLALVNLGAIAFSAYKLNEYTRRHPELFGN